MNGARSTLRYPVRAGENRAGDGEEPLLSGAALQRRRLSRPFGQRRNAPRQGRRRLGGAVHRAGGDPPYLGDHALHRAEAVGRRRHADAGAHRRCHPRGRGAGRHRAVLQRHERPQSLFTRDAAGAHGPAHPHLFQRPGAGAGHGQEGHRRFAPLAPQRGVAGEKMRLRPHLRLWRPRVRHHPAFSVAAHQPEIRRVWRQPGEPGASA